MEKHRKIVFLDIDGTLVDFESHIPASTIEALKRARAQGHHMVICSGRSRYQMYPELLALGFDGIVGAAGQYVEHGGKVIFQATMDLPHRQRLFPYLEKHGFIYSVQTEHNMVMNLRCKEGIAKIYSERISDSRFVEQILGDARIMEDLTQAEGAEKVVFQNLPLSIEDIRQDLCPDFTVTELSYKDSAIGGEIGLGSCTKATGIQKYLDAVGATRADTIAIGDGPNDLEMLAFAQVGIAMGNARSSVKAVADDVTEDIHRDGIYAAFQKYGLI